MGGGGLQGAYFLTSSLPPLSKRPSSSLLLPQFHSFPILTGHSVPPLPSPFLPLYFLPSFHHHFLVIYPLENQRKEDGKGRVLLLRYRKRKKKMRFPEQNRKVERYGKQKLKGFLTEEWARIYSRLFAKAKFRKFLMLKFMAESPKIICLSSYVLLVFENHAFFKQ